MSILVLMLFTGIVAVGIMFAIVLVISNQGGGKSADSGDPHAFQQQMQQRKMTNKLIAGLVVMTVFAIIIGMVYYFLMNILPV